MWPDVLCDQRAMSALGHRVYSTRASSFIDAPMCCSPPTVGLRVSWDKDGELGEPRTALGVVSGRHSRMLQR